MRYPKSSVLVDILKTKQSHHKGEMRNLKFEDMEIEKESTNNEDQSLNKSIPFHCSAKESRQYEISRMR